MTEINKAIKEIENLLPAFSPDSDDNGGYTEIQSALKVALTSLRSQSEAKKLIEAVKEYCRNRIERLEEKTTSCSYREQEIKYRGEEIGYENVLEFLRDKAGVVGESDEK